VAADALCAVPLAVVVRALLEVVRQTRPDAVLSYDAGGGYGHPDHVRVHEMTAHAHAQAVREGMPLTRFSVVAPEPVMRSAVERLRRQGVSTLDPNAWPSMVVPASQVDLLTGGEALRHAKAAALRAHATQVVVAPDESSFALSNGVWQPLLATEGLHQEPVAASRGAGTSP